MFVCYSLTKKHCWFHTIVLHEDLWYICALCIFNMPSRLNVTSSVIWTDAQNLATLHTVAGNPFENFTVGREYVSTMYKENYKPWTSINPVINPEPLGDKGYNSFSWSTRYTFRWLAPFERHIDSLFPTLSTLPRIVSILFGVLTICEPHASLQQGICLAQLSVQTAKKSCIGNQPFWKMLLVKLLQFHLWNAWPAIRILLQLYVRTSFEGRCEQTVILFIHLPTSSLLKQTNWLPNTHCITKICDLLSCS